MTRRRPVPGHIGWLLLFLYVAVWDFHPRTETLSSAFCPGAMRGGRKIYLVIWVFLTLHLTRVLPYKYDPLRRLTEEVLHT